MKNISATYKGLVTGGLMIVACIVCYFGLKIPFNSKEQFIILAIYSAGIVWSLVTFKAAATEEKKFKDYFQTGFKTFIVVTLLMVVYCIVFYNFNTGIRDAWIADNNQMLLKEGNHMPAEIAENAKKMKSIFLPMMVGINLFKYLIIGVLITVITAGFLSQKK
jgi:cbb3-type cytochrome oxidase subunit 3